MITLKAHLETSQAIKAKTVEITTEALSEIRLLFFQRVHIRPYPPISLTFGTYVHISAHTRPPNSPLPYGAIIPYMGNISRRQRSRRRPSCGYPHNSTGYVGRLPGSGHFCVARKMMDGLYMAPGWMNWRILSRLATGWIRYFRLK